jgi:hypothetical protein
MEVEAGENGVGEDFEIHTGGKFQDTSRSG